jgi:hypothetical protein
MLLFFGGGDSIDSMTRIWGNRHRCHHPLLFFLTHISSFKVVPSACRPLPVDHVRGLHLNCMSLLTACLLFEMPLPH